VFISNAGIGSAVLGPVYCEVLLLEAYDAAVVVAPVARLPAKTSRMLCQSYTIIHQSKPAYWTSQRKAKNHIWPHTALTLEKSSKPRRVFFAAISTLTTYPDLTMYPIRPMNRH